MELLEGNSMRIQEERVFSQAVEDYVKAIYKLQIEGQAVSTNDLAHKMGKTAAAATKMIKHLADSKLIDYTKHYGVRLTPAGEKVALETIRHHRLIELYLHQALGYSWDEVDAEAEKLEHHISEDFEDPIDRMLDFPSTDPHGDPIPTRDGVIAPAKGKPLSDSEPGETLVILRVTASNPEARRYLARLGMTLDAVTEVEEK